MRIFFMSFVLLSAGHLLIAQSGNIGIGTSAPHHSSRLEVASDTSGILVPRMTNLQRDAIMDPATGLMVFVTTDSMFYYYDGTGWVTFIDRTAVLRDIDDDTKVQVEASPDEDKIRFSTGGTEALIIDNTGFVGIGTSTPEGNLEIAGSALRTRMLINNTAVGDPALGFRLSGTSRVMMGIDNNDSDKFKIALSDTLGVNDAVTITTSGNVGIGTSNPSTELHVNGTIQAGNELSYDKIRVYPASHYALGFNEAQTLGFLNSYAMTFSMFDHPSYGWLWRGHQDSSSDGAMSLTADGRLYVKSTAAFNGNVGIGTLTPGAKLDVVGDAGISGNVGIGTLTPSAKLDVMGDAEFNGVIESGLTDSYDKIRVYPSANYTIGMKSAQSLGFLNDWAMTFTMDNIVSRGWLWRGVSDSAADGAMSLTTDGRLYVKGTASINGNVGIGTTSPSQKLTVVGNSELYGFLNAIYGIRAGSFGSPGSWGMYVTGTGYLTDFLRVDGGIHVGGASDPGTDNLIVDGNVGIGTTSPSQKLDLVGNAEISGYVTTFGGIHVGGSSAPGADDLIVDGMIGIGTLAPAMSLDVNGNARIGSGSGGGGLLDIIGNGDLQGNVVINRTSTDGILIRFRRDGGTQGSIDVAGGTVSYNAFTGSHYAWTDESPGRGMLVSLTGHNKTIDGTPDSEIVYGVRICATANHPGILGSYLAPEIADTADGYRPHLVMSVGNGEMWIADMGEDIAIGDYLISSGVPGHAMKDVGAHEVSHIIARAAEAISWESVDSTVNGVRHRKISVLFESFERNHQVEKVRQELDRVRTELQALYSLLELTSPVQSTSDR